MISNILHTPGLRAVVLKTYGSGNAPQKPWFIELLRDATSRGIIIVNISQCSTGTVEMGRYETGLHLLDAGVISGYDSTVESVLTKLMFLWDTEKVKRNTLPNEYSSSRRVYEIIIYCVPIIIRRDDCRIIKMV